MKHYNAIFKETTEAIEVSFPDLEGCLTFADNWDEAFANATDALGGWLANAEASFKKEPSSHSALSEKLKRGEELVPVPVDEKIIESYEELKRINVIFKKETLEKVDEYREKTGLKRSTLLQMAAEEYMDNHPSNDDKHIK